MVDDQTTGESGPGEYHEVVITKNMETLDVVSSHVIPVKAERAYMGEHINIMTQVLQTKGSSLNAGCPHSKHIHWVEER